MALFGLIIISKEEKYFRPLRFQKMSANLMNLDYESRGLDICQFCALKYNVGERIPRILVHCGHTLCTNCIQQLHHKDRVRCPICRKLIKQLESAERLPLNINILYEVVEKDPILARTSFDFEDEDEESLCLLYTSDAADE